jgi:hypothetical protein
MSQKIACCISGYPSSRIIEHMTILKSYYSFDYFIFFWDVISNDLKSKVNCLLQPKDILYTKPIDFPFDAKYKEPDKQSSKNDSLSMFYGITEVQKLRKNYEEKTKSSYDIIIRMRYDNHLLDNFNVVLQKLHNTLTNDNVIFPFEHHHIGICDQLWFGKKNAMDKFISLFDWIKSNINTIFYVNENVLFQFVMAMGLSYNCIDIKYILRREYLINSPATILYREYEKQSKLPWIASCPTKMERLYQNYIYNKNNSANTIFFLSKCIYQDIPCKLFNPKFNKFLSVNIKNLSSYITGTCIPTIFKLHVCSSFMISIIVPLDVLQPLSKSDMVLSMQGGRLICTNNFDSPLSQFFIVKKENKFYFVSGDVSSDKNVMCLKPSCNSQYTCDVLINGDMSNDAAAFSVIC